MVAIIQDTHLHKEAQFAEQIRSAETIRHTVKRDTDL